MHEQVNAFILEDQDIFSLFSYGFKVEMFY